MASTGQFSDCPIMDLGVKTKARLLRPRVQYVLGVPSCRVVCLISSGPRESASFPVVPESLANWE